MIKEYNERIITPQNSWQVWEAFLHLIKSIFKNMNEDYEGYKWIKVKKYKMDDSKSWEERYKELEQHHIEETTFLINKVRELAKKT